MTAREWARLLLLGIGPTVWIYIWFLAWLNDYRDKD